jgi:hypothetical protein
LVLLLVLLCDYYYVFYCVLAGGLVLGLRAVRRGDSLFWLRPPFALPVAIFAGASAASAGLLVVPLLALAVGDPLSGVHDAGEFSLDLPALWIPGGLWRFAALTESYWSRLPDSLPESSVHLGFAATLGLVLAWTQRRRFRDLELGAWWLILAFFAAASLGPYLRIWGRAYPVVLPYRLLEILVPPLRLSGAPVRMVVMVTLAGGILVGLAVDELLRRGRAARLGAALLLLVVVFELLPAPLPTYPAGSLPGWVTVLAGLPKGFGFMDVAGVRHLEQMYFQTAHGVPMFEGAVSRTPSSVIARNERLYARRRRTQFESLCTEFGFAYFLFPRGSGARSMPVLPLWSDDAFELYDVRAAWPCAVTTR